MNNALYTEYCRISLKEELADIILRFKKRVGESIAKALLRSPQGAVDANSKLFGVELLVQLLNAELK